MCLCFCMDGLVFFCVCVCGGGGGEVVVTVAHACSLEITSSNNKLHKI